VQAYAWASAVAPEDKRYQQILARTHHRYMAQHEQEMALLLEMNQRNRERQQRMLAGTTAGRPPSGTPSAIPVPAAARPPKSTIHEAMTRYGRELMEWNRLNQMGQARGMPPIAPRPGIDFDH
jgi:hypothetical protein